MTRLLLALLWFVAAGWCLSMGWRMLTPKPKPAATIVNGPNTGWYLRPSHKVGELRVWHYVENGITLRGASNTKLERRKADNSGPAEDPQ